MKRNIPQVRSLSPGSNLLTNHRIMTKNSKKRVLKGKRPKPLTVKIADNLVKKSEENEKLRQKRINTDFFNLFKNEEE
jgi:hypothetical protein